MKKMIIVSPETHSSLFFIKGEMQGHQGKNITLDEVVNIIVSYYMKQHNTTAPFKLEEKE